MHEIGTVLREARENRGFELNDVYDALRINPRYLKAMEKGEYDQLPSQAHVRGYMRKYARFLGLDAEPLLERYTQFRDKTPPPLHRPTEDEPLPKMIMPPEDEAGTFFDHLNNDLAFEEEQKRSDFTGWLIIAALVFFIALLSWRFLPFVLGTEPNTSLLEGIAGAVSDFVGQETLPEPAAVEPAAVEAEPLESTTELVVPTGRTSGSTATVGEDGELQGQLPPPTPTRNPLPATIDVIDMQIDITERTWVAITVDEIVLFEGQAKRGDTFNFTGNDFVTIRTGNAFGVVVRINDIDVGRLGERQQVVDQTWETTQ
ncbi:MAG: DUF4115 domain-containing protein [Ardenticatenaceae bacterium]|nr:DUF4115 domain-containing protein [Ardenticatenaceae bacterium]